MAFEHATNLALDFVAVDDLARLIELLPAVPIRQWVLSFPFAVRYLLAYDAKLCAAVLRILVRTILAWLRERAANRGIPGG